MKGNLIVIGLLLLGMGTFFVVIMFGAFALNYLTRNLSESAELCVHLIICICGLAIVAIAILAGSPLLGGRP